MSLNISVRHDYHRIERRLTDVHRRQLPFATAAALTDAAKLAAGVVTRELPDIFDRPIPFTMHAIGTSPARKDNLAALVFVKDRQAKYLLPEEIGGTRTGADNTNSPSKALIVPSKIQLNAFGNIPFGALKQLVADANVSRVFTVQTAKEMRRLKRQQRLGNKGVFYLAGRAPWGTGAGGFFRRLGGGKVQRLLSFEPSAHYKPRFGFRRRVEAAARGAFRVAFAARLREAIETAR